MFWRTNSYHRYHLLKQQTHFNCKAGCLTCQDMHFTRVGLGNSDKLVYVFGPILIWVVLVKYIWFVQIHHWTDWNHKGLQSKDSLSYNCTKFSLSNKTNEADYSHKNYISMYSFFFGFYVITEIRYMLTFAQHLKSYSSCLCWPDKRDKCLTIWGSKSGICCFMGWSEWS